VVCSLTGNLQVGGAARAAGEDHGDRPALLAALATFGIAYPAVRVTRRETSGSSMPSARPPACTT
jgi:hypothetical protein